MDKSEQKSQILVAMDHFETAAKSVIQELSEYLKDKIEISSNWGKNKLQSYNLDKGQFHGGSCGFINSKTGQLIDVKMFGEDLYLPNGNFYLLRYIQTTLEFKALSKNLDSEKEFIALLEELVAEKKLINKHDQPPYFQAIRAK